MGGVGAGSKNFYPLSDHPSAKLRASRDGLEKREEFIVTRPPHSYRADLDEPELYSVVAFVFDFAIPAQVYRGQYSWRSCRLMCSGWYFE